MSFIGLLPKVIRKDRIDSSFATIESGKSVHRVYKELDNEINSNFTINFIYLLDVAFVSDNLYALTIEQQKFIEKYFVEADNIEEENLSLLYAQFDTFLGSFIGE